MSQSPTEHDHSLPPGEGGYCPACSVEHDARVDLVQMSIGPRYDARCACGWESQLWHFTLAAADADATAHIEETA